MSILDWLFGSLSVVDEADVVDSYSGYYDEIPQTEQELFVQTQGDVRADNETNATQNYFNRPLNK